jgi:hypothetical protein
MRILMIGTAFACIFAFNPAVAGPFESGAATFDTEATLLLLTELVKGKIGNALLSHIYRLGRIGSVNGNRTG